METTTQKRISDYIGEYINMGKPCPPMPMYECMAMGCTNATIRDMCHRHHIGNDGMGW